MWVLNKNIGYLSALILLTMFLYFWLRKMLSRSFKREESDYATLEDEYKRQLLENEKLKEGNFNLEKTARDTIVLYDIAKEICRSLDEDKVFINFCSQITRYIEVDDCKLLKDSAKVPHKGYTVLPLSIDKNTFRYLAVSQIEEQDKDKFHILCQQFLLGMKRALLYQRVQELAVTDSLTNVFSRRYLLERFNEEIERSKKFKYNFAFLMADIDHFKDYNDRYGHLVGDAILREISRAIKENIRQIDLVGRYGGEEFSVILTETNKEEAELAAERIRQAIERRKVRVYDEDLQVTISIGVAIFPSDGSGAQALIEKADEALYRAKQTGRNRVCINET